MVLLYDELDHYVDSTSTAKSFFNALAKAHETFPNQIGILVAGGLGVYKLQAEIGSDFTNGALFEHLTSFERHALTELAEPFQGKRGKQLGEQVIDAIYAFSGGNPRIATYMLHECWKQQGELDATTILTISDHFRQHTEFKEDVLRGLGISDPESDANKVWSYIDQRDSPYQRSDLLRTTQVSALAVDRSLKLLNASGVIRVHGSVDAEVLDAERIPSLLRPLTPREYVEPAEQTLSRVELFDRDITPALGYIHRWGLGFYRDKDKKELVPEWVFAVFLASQLDRAGWHADCEAMQGPGFIDIKLRHPCFPDAPAAIIEVKLWSNRDKKTVHKQTVDYLSEPGEPCMAVVMIGSQALSREEMKNQYRADCLPENEYAVAEDNKDPAPLVAKLMATKKAGDGADIPVRHYVLNLPRRRR